MNIEMLFQMTTAIDALGDYRNIEATYDVTDLPPGDDPEHTALEAVREAAPGVLKNLKLDSLEIESRIRADAFRIVARYVRRSSSSSSGASDKPLLSFQCGGGSARMTVAKSQRKIIGDDAIDPGLYIGWNGKSNENSNVEGTDVATAQTSESYTKKMPVATVTGDDFRRTIAALTSHVNDAPFKGWQRGEVLFLDCSFTESDTEDEIAVTFHFSVKPNEEINLSELDPDSSGTAEKEGHEYLWTITKTVASEDGKAPRVKVKGAWISQVYAYGDFSKLGI